MERIWTTELAAHAGERVLLKGWLHRLRRLSQVSFLVLRDGKGFVPTADTVLQAGDEVLAVLDPSLEEDLTAYFGPAGERAGRAGRGDGADRGSPG